MYVELWLGELETSNIILQLADRSVKIPRGGEGCIGASG